MEKPQDATKALKNWVMHYLARRALSESDARPLYMYATTDAERVFLADLLSEHASERNNPTYGIYWAAGICLFIADKYRRDYMAEWSWQAFYTELGINLSATERAELVKTGLEFWKRPLRHRSQGTDYLGSLFAEGGLPWRLLQSEQHGFGRAIKAGLRHYHDSHHGLNLEPVMREFGHAFPQSFQNEEKYQLLARIAETLMHLAETYALDQQQDPAAFLNQQVPRWREHFPLPLGEDNGIALVNEWLRDAGSQLKRRKREDRMAPMFSCEHWLDGDKAAARLKATVRLSQSLCISLQDRRLSTTRVALALYEGERLALKLGAAYGQLDNGILSVPLPVEVTSLPRQSPEAPLLLVVSSGGEHLETRLIPSSDVDWQHLPSVFEEEDHAIRLVGTASVQCEAASVLLRVPDGMQGPTAEPLLVDVAGARWYRLQEECVLVEPEARYVIEPGTASGHQRVELSGDVLAYSSLPLSIWRGFPRCQLINAQQESQAPEAIRVNGRLVSRLESLNRLGTFKVDILGEGQRLVARRKLGVLPRDFSLTSRPASSQAPARLVVHSAKALALRVLNAGIQAEIHQDGSERTIELHTGDEPSGPVCLEIRDPDTHLDGVMLRVPFPKQGAQLKGAEGQPFPGTAVMLDDILGMTLTLTPPPDTTRTFTLSLELVGSSALPFKRYHYRLDKTTDVSLYALYDDILSLLSSSDEQDTRVRCRVETSQILKQFYFYRYGASVRFTNAYREYFELLDQDGKPLTHRADKITAMAMLLEQPEKAPVEILPERVNGVATGVYALPQTLRKGGPWLLYPAEGASVVFRPAIHAPGFDACRADATPPIKTLNSAAHYYHPQHCPAAFDQVLDDMAAEYFHPSWIYLVQLKGGYPHLPLSALESWKHLAGHPDALALAVFRLEMTPMFADRLIHELAVVWESITVAQWQTAVQISVKAVAGQFGIPAAQCLESVRKRMRQLAVTVPVFKDFLEVLCAPEQPLPGAPSMNRVLPTWFIDMRTRHHDQQKDWPTNLDHVLTTWLGKQEGHAWISQLERPDHTNAVFLMPLLAASMTAGETRMKDLAVDGAELRFGFRVLSDFDRTEWYEPAYSTALFELLNAKRSQA